LEELLKQEGLDINGNDITAGTPLEEEDISLSSINDQLPALDLNGSDSSQGRETAEGSNSTQTPTENANAVINNGEDPNVNAGVDPNVNAGVDPNVNAGVDPNVNASVDPNGESNTAIEVNNIIGDIGDNTTEVPKTPAKNTTDGNQIESASELTNLDLNLNGSTDAHPTVETESNDNHHANSQSGNENEIVNNGAIINQGLNENNNGGEGQQNDINNNDNNLGEDSEGHLNSANNKSDNPELLTKNITEIPGNNTTDVNNESGNSNPSDSNEGKNNLNPNKITLPESNSTPGIDTKLNNSPSVSGVNIDEVSSQINKVNTRSTDNVTGTTPVSNRNVVDNTSKKVDSIATDNNITNLDQPDVNQINNTNIKDGNISPNEDNQNIIDPYQIPKVNSENTDKLIGLNEPIISDIDLKNKIMNDVKDNTKPDIQSPQSGHIDLNKPDIPSSNTITSSPSLINKIVTGNNPSNSLADTPQSNSIVNSTPGNLVDHTLPTIDN